MTPDERLAAKRANEGTRALATFFNNLAVGTIIAGFVAPSVSGHPEPWWAVVMMAVLAVCIHLCAQWVLRRFLKPED